MNNKNKNPNPNRYGEENDPFCLDPKFTTGLMGHESAPIHIDPDQTVEEAEAQPDPAMEAWGKNLSRDVLARANGKSELRNFIENVTDDDILEAAETIRDPEVLAQMQDEVEDIRHGKEAERFLTMRPEYYVDDQNYERLVAYLDANELEFTAENLCEAYDALFENNHLVVDREVVKPLTEGEELRVARLVISGQIDKALWKYLEYSLPGLDVIEIRHDVPNNPKFTDLVREALYFLFRQSTSEYQHSDDFIRYLHDFADDRTWSLELIRAAWHAYQRDAILRSQQGPELTPEDLDNLSEEEQEKLFKETMRLRARQLKKVPNIY